MSQAPIHPPVSSQPEAEREQSRWQALLFLGKAWVFRTQRTLLNLGNAAPRRLSSGAASGPVRSIAESRSALYSSESAAEFSLQAGKVQNLRLAAAALNGLLIPSGEIFSFWAHVRRPVRWRGFVAGRELREGCIIPSVGGGLCQISNALYDVALMAGCEIVERHAHSRKLPGSMAVAGRDATVFWNYVDLRFRPHTQCRLEARLSQRELIVRLHSFDRVAVSNRTEKAASPEGSSLDGELPPVESCETCGVTSCFRHAVPRKGTTGATTAWLVDAWWPEFDRYLQSGRRTGDWLFLPLDGIRWRTGSYRWKTSGFSRVRQAPAEVLIRSRVSRRLAAQGAERQRALLRFDEALARRYARSVPFSATHLVVSLNLLPFLWRDGVLGGRTFDVLMTRQPLRNLQQVLDLAQERHPESRTLSDFRVAPELVEAESAALAEAQHWITPHREIAKLGREKSLLLDWIVPSATPAAEQGSRIAFPGSTLGRKGAYELREVARRLGLRVSLAGPAIEDSEFWSGVDAAPAESPWISDACAVVLPAWVEHQPRRLLQALAARVPVIASNACGLEGVPGVISVPTGDVEALETALRSILTRPPAQVTTPSHTGRRTA